MSFRCEAEEVSLELLGLLTDGSPLRRSSGTRTPPRWYVLFGHELIWKNREPFVKLWHDFRTRRGPGGGGGGGDRGGAI